MSALAETQQIVAGHMDDILKCFKAGAKITVLVRFPDKPTADFLMTDDDPNAVVAMIRRRQAETAAAQPGLTTAEQLMSSHERGQRDMLNLLLTPNKAAADAVAAIMDTDPATNPDGKLSFETVCWIAEIAAQIGLEPKDEVAPA